MVGDGEPVGLVADPLEQVQHRAGPGDPQRLGQAGPEHQLLLLGQRGPLQLVQPQGGQGRAGGVQLAQAAVDEHQVREGQPLVAQPLVAPGQHLGHVGEVVVLLVGHLEPAVALPVGQAIAEHHAGGHHLPPLAVADIEALDALRQPGQAQEPLQPLQHGLVQPGRLELALQRQAGVFLGHAQQLHLLAPLRDMDDRQGAAHPAQPLPQQGQFVGLQLHQDPAGHRLLGVDPLEHLRQHRAVEGLHVLDQVLPARHHPPLAHHQPVHAGLPVQHRAPVQIGVLLVQGGRLLPVEPEVQLLQRVPVLCRQLEGAVFRRLPHGRLQMALELVPVPFQEQLGAPGLLAVGGFVHRRHTGGGAPVQLVLQAGPAAPAIDLDVAVADLEEPVDQFRRAVGGGGREERAEIEGAVLLHLAGDEHLREGVLPGQLHVRVALVVPQQDVVRRPVLLDEVVLQDQGLQLRGADHELQVPDPRHQPPGLGVQLLGVEVALHPVAQHLGLAHVEQRARLVPVQVHPGLGGQIGELAPQGGAPVEVGARRGHGRVYRDQGPSRPGWPA